MYLYTIRASKLIVPCSCNLKLFFIFEQPVFILFEGFFIHLINPWTAKLFNLNFHSPEVVSRWRDPQLHLSENYSDLIKWRSTILKVEVNYFQNLKFSTSSYVTLYWLFIFESFVFINRLYRLPGSKYIGAEVWCRFWINAEENVLLFYYYSKYAESSCETSPDGYGAVSDESHHHK